MDFRSGFRCVSSDICSLNDTQLTDIFFFWIRRSSNNHAVYIITHTYVQVFVSMCGYKVTAYLQGKDFRTIPPPIIGQIPNLWRTETDVSWFYIFYYCWNFCVCCCCCWCNEFPYLLFSDYHPLLLVLLKVQIWLLRLICSCHMQMHYMLQHLTTIGNNSNDTQAFNFWRRPKSADTCTHIHTHSQIPNTPGEQHQVDLN